MKGKTIYYIARSSWAGYSYTFDDIRAFESEEERDSEYAKLMDSGDIVYDCGSCIIE